MTAFWAATLTMLFGLPTAQSAGSGCQLVDPKHPAQYLTFERTGRGKTAYAGESEERVWLRLHNNVTCPIQVRGGRPHVEPDGSISMDPRDGEEAEIEYEVYDSKRGGDPRPWGGTDTYSVGAVRPGFSVVFDVPLSHFRRGMGVAVRFSYSWEHASLSDFRIRHYVYLVPEDVPAAVRGELKR